MADRDRFELDLAAALRTYLEEAPTEVRPTDLARHFATEHHQIRVDSARLLPALDECIRSGHIKRQPDDSRNS